MKPSDISLPTRSLVNASVFSKSNARALLITKLLSAVLLSFFLVIPNVASADLNTGLMAWWPLNGSAVDASGNGNNGQVNGPVPCEDRFGNPVGAMCFNGALADNINIGNQVKPPFPFTITAWMKPDTVDGDKLIIRNDLWSYNYLGAIFYITDGARLAGAYGDGGLSAPASRTTALTERGVVVAGDWQHVAVVFNAHRDIRLYHNCIEYPVAGYAGTGDTMRYSTANGAIGLGSTGVIDDMRVYNRSLSSGEIDRLCQEGPGWFGNTLQTGSSYEFSIEQGTQKTDSIQVFNPGDVPRTATLAIVNPHADLTVSLPPGPIIIAPGETETLSLQIDAASVPVGVYDGILLKITVDDGSTLYTSIKVNVVSSGTGQLPDLTITANDISSVTNAGGTVTLTATVHNWGNSSATNVQVRFYEFDNPLGETVIAQIPANGISDASITVPMAASGDHLIRVVVDPAGTIPELDETNNQASRIVQPGGSPGPTAGNILVTGSLPTTVYTGSLFTLSGSAVYDLYVNGVRNTDYVVKGGSVQITVEGNAVYGAIHTDVNGNFAKTLQAPATPGTYRITMTVTDKTFEGTRDLTFKVESPPPTPPSPPPPPTISGVGHWTYDAPTGAWTWTWTTPPPSNEPTPERDLRVFSEKIYFSKNNPAPDDEITLFAEIQYWATNTSLISDAATVNVYVTDPATHSKMKVGQTVINSLSVGSPDFGSRYVYATWKNRAAGIYLVEFEIVPSYIEYTGNNAATRAIIVGQSQQGVISGQVTTSLDGVGDVMIHVFDAGGTSPIGVST